MISWAWLSKSYITEISVFQLALNTLLVAIIASITTVLLSILLGFSSKYFKSKIINVSNQLASLGYSTPGAVIAMGSLILVGYISDTFNILLSGTMLLLFFAYIVRFLAVAYQPIESGFEKNCEDLNNASKTLGSSPMRSLYSLNLPLIKNTIIAAGLLVFIDATKELPLTLILRPFNFETLATYTYQFAHDELIEQASLPALLIIFAGLLPVIFMNKYLREVKV